MRFDLLAVLWAAAWLYTTPCQRSSCTQVNSRKKIYTTGAMVRAAQLAAALCLIAISFCGAVAQDDTCSLIISERDTLSQRLQAVEQEVSALSSRATAAEAQVASERQALNQWQQAHADLQTQISQLTASSQAAAAQLLTAQAEAQVVPTLTKERNALKKQLDALQAKATFLEAELVQVQTQVANLQEQTSLPAIVKLAAAAGYAQAAALADSTQAVVMELAQGNTTRLQATAAQVADNYKFVAGAANALLQRELEEHLPQVKAHMSQVNALWDQHVTQSAWMKQIKGTTAVVEAEIKVFLTTHAAKVPTLATLLSDPVNLQLVTYSIFAMPLTLLFVSLVIMCCRAPSGSSLPTSSSSSKKRRSKPKTAGRPGV